MDVTPGHYVGFGHSHTASLAWACEALEVDDPGHILHATVNFLLPPYYPEYSDQDGVRTLNPAWVQTMQEELSDPDAIIFFCVCGSEWWSWSLTPGPRPFDFVDPIADDGAPLIGEAIAYELFLRKAVATFQAIRFVTDTVRHYTQAPIVQLAPPPPGRDIEADVLADPSFGPLVREYGLSPPPFRLKVWRACARAMEIVCHAAGIGFLMPPTEGLDAEGYLLPAFRHDPIHGNAAWGRLQLIQLGNVGGAR
jgi:hypothetical protein